MKKSLKFPESFLWGAATSSYQVEGRIWNNDWAEAACEGKVPAAGLACDHYRRYEEDFDIAKSLGHNSHRFSIEWSRIEPEEGKFDRDAIEHYQDVLKALRARGLTPFVTLWHFTLPTWLSDRGGVAHKKFPEYFARYCEYVVKQLNSRDAYFATLNEPLVFSALGWIGGKWPPFKTKSFLSFFGVSRNLVHAHNLAYEKIKGINIALRVGVVKNNKYVRSNLNPFNRFLAVLSNWYWNHWFLNRTHKKMDFIGLNYYFHQSFGIKEHFPTSDFGWSIFPEGIYHALLALKRYHKPIYITENGVADSEDKQRAEFIKNHLYWVHRAIEQGAVVRGYFYWSLLDNFEWAEGFKMHFGLVEVNFETQKRTIRPSAEVYKKVCEANSLLI